MKLAPPIAQIFQEYRDIVIRRLMRIAACAGAEQHDALDPIAVELIEGSAEAPQDVLIGCGPRHCAGSAGSNLLERSHYATRIQDPVALDYKQQTSRPTNVFPRPTDRCAVPRSTRASWWTDWAGSPRMGRACSTVAMPRVSRPARGVPTSRGRLDAEDLSLLLQRDVRRRWVLWAIGDIGKIIIVKLDGRASKLPGMNMTK